MLTMGIYVEEKITVYLVFNKPWLQASTGGVETSPLWIREDYYTVTVICIEGSSVETKMQGKISEISNLTVSDI